MTEEGLDYSDIKCPITKQFCIDSMAMIRFGKEHDKTMNEFILRVDKFLKDKGLL